MREAISIPNPSQPSIGEVRDNQRLDEAALNTWFRTHVADPAAPATTFSARSTAGPSSTAAPKPRLSRRWSG